MRLIGFQAAQRPGPCVWPGKDVVLFAPAHCICQQCTLLVPGEVADTFSLDLFSIKE